MLERENVYAVWCDPQTKLITVYHPARQCTIVEKCPPLIFIKWVFPTMSSTYSLYYTNKPNPNVTYGVGGFHHQDFFNLFQNTMDTNGILSVVPEDVVFPEDLWRYASNYQWKGMAETDNYVLILEQYPMMKFSVIEDGLSVCSSHWMKASNMQAFFNMVTQSERIYYGFGKTSPSINILNSVNYNRLLSKLAVLSGIELILLDPLTVVDSIEKMHIAIKLGKIVPDISTGR